MIDPGDFQPVKRVRPGASKIPSLYVSESGIATNRALTEILVPDTAEIEKTSANFGKVYLSLSYNRVHKAFRIIRSYSVDDFLFQYRFSHGTLSRYIPAEIKALEPVKGAYRQLKDQPDVFVLDVTIKR